MVGLRPGLRILDVGCGGGRHMVRLRRHGCEVWGIEPDREAARRAGLLGFRVHAGTIEDAPFPLSWFDVVSFIHVVEHLADPVRALSRAAEFLKEGGRMLILTPNGGSLTFRWLRGAWYPLDLPRHLHVFDAGALSEACRRAGLSVRRWSVRPHAGKVRRSLANGGGPVLAALARSAPGWLATRIAARVLNMIFRDGEVLSMVAVKTPGRAASLPRSPAPGTIQVP